MKVFVRQAPFFRRENLKRLHRNCNFMKFLSVKTKNFITAAAIIFVFFVFNNTASAQKKSKKSDAKPIARQKIVVDFDAYTFRIFDLVNAERTKRGLSELSWDDDVAKIAADYSKKMARENFFGHFDADGKSVLDRAKAARLKHWSRIGENLFSIESTGNFDVFAVKNWMKSPTHRENILTAEWTTTGIGIARAEDGEIFVTQVFIKR